MIMVRLKASYGNNISNGSFFLVIKLWKQYLEWFILSSNQVMVIVSWMVIFSKLFHYLWHEGFWFCWWMVD